MHSAGVLARDGISVVKAAGGLSTKNVKAGHYVKFANHSKIYMVLRDIVVGSAPVTLHVYPALIKGVPTNTRIELVPNISVLWDLTALEELTYNNGVVVNAVIGLEENLNV